MFQLIGGSSFMHLSLGIYPYEACSGISVSPGGSVEAWSAASCSSATHYGAWVLILTLTIPPYLVCFSPQPRSLNSLASVSRILDALPHIAPTPIRVAGCLAHSALKATSCRVGIGRMDRRAVHGTVHPLCSSL